MSEANTNRNNSLYIANLDPTIDEATLFNAFSGADGLTTVHICLDRISGKSLGYAYVNFESMEDADKAMRDMNFTEIGDREIRISWSNRNRAERQAPDKNLFVRNLPPSTDSKALHDLFSTIGTVFSCKVAVDEEGGSKGYGFVQMETKEEADHAIEELNGQEMNGSVIEVASYIPPQKRIETWTNCYFKFLPKQMKEEEVREFFSMVGEVNSLHLPPAKDPKSEGEVNAGYGFVNFVDHDTAVRAVEELNGHQFEKKKEEEEEEEGKEASQPGFFIQKQLGKKELNEKKRNQKQERRRALNKQYANRNLYVRNIPLDYNENRLNELFSEYGDVLNVRIDRDYETGESTGVGYVCMGTVEDAQNALENLTGEYLHDKPLIVQVFKSKEERQREAMQKKKFNHATVFCMATHQQGGIMEFYLKQQQQLIEQQKMLESLMKNHQAQQDAHQVEEEGHSLQAIVNMNAESRRVFFGERLYPLVSRNVGDYMASKVTGVLLEMEPSELMLFLEDQFALDQKVNEIVHHIEEEDRKENEERRDEIFRSNSQVSEDGESKHLFEKEEKEEDDDDDDDDDDDFIMLKIEEGSAVWRQVCKLMHTRWQSEHIGKNKYDRGMNHFFFRVKNIWRVENTSLWQKYANRRAEVEAFVENPPFVNSVNNSELEHSLGLDELRREVLLFYRSFNTVDEDQKTKLSTILREGFKKKPKSTKSAFGSAVYFSNKSSKSDGHCPIRSETSVGETCQMILARVTMGNTYRTSSDMKKTKRPPFIEEGSSDRFDSIWFDGSKKNYEEYMVYNRYQCYPEFVVEYERI